MDSVQSDDQAGARRRRRLSVALREALRDMSVQLSLLNHQVGGRLELKGSDLECCDLLNRYGPLSPGELAQRAGLHPATMTGVLDRLERGGWVARERDPADRRAVIVRLLRDRNGEVLALYAGMNAAMDEICAGYTEPELELLAGFLRRTSEAGRSASRQLAGG
ncbi:MAG TPA: MarR family transcriptional regulator [Streptosporangiaceae bacterium]|jgi:DNA-binding MarR family transcriptional regulator|nr:MarR family transcriptional regulator [Streptosporangiaceae bacterium]